MKTTTEKKKTDLVIITSNETAQVAFGKMIKAEIEKASLTVRNIEITDISSLKIGTGLTTELNVIVKRIEDKRKALKEPYIQGGKLIDTVAQELSAPAMEALDVAKKKIVAFQSAEQERIRKEEEELNKKHREEEQRIAADAKHKSDIQKRIFDFEAEAISAINKADKDALKEVAKFYIDEGPKADEFEEFAEQYKESVERIKVAGRTRFFALKELAKLAADKSDLAQKQAELKKQQMELDAQQASLAAAQAKEEISEMIEEGIAIAEEINDAETKAELLEINTNHGPAMRETYQFEIINEEEIPKYWMSLDEKKIREWLKRCKEQDEANPGKNSNLPKDREVFSGIKFTIKKTPILRST